MKIFINPGHGGADPGACGNGLREADVALKIGRHVAVFNDPDNVIIFRLAD